jgi:hypothetical protein
MRRSWAIVVVPVILIGICREAGRTAELCERSLPKEVIQFTGLYPAIEEMISLTNFRAGEVVEIDPDTMPADEAKSYIRDIAGLGARVSIYIVGGHCELGPNCDSLPKTVRQGPTGSWNWDQSERRILDITHPAVLSRIAQKIERGWQLGANYIRIDNLHHPAGSTHPRTPDQMKTIIDLGQGIEDRLRASGVIERERVTGLVAHNNLTAWENLIESGKLRQLPALLTSERTAQLADLPNYEGDIRLKRGTLSPSDVPDIQAGRRLATYFQIPYSVVEFRMSHDLTRRGQKYLLPQRYVDAIRSLSGVSEVIVIRDETHYVGRDEVFEGAGPKTLPASPPAPLAALGSKCSLPPLSE